ncbi:MAG TPA: homoserine O-acetyltransferase [Stellaceae bacterium]|jgi:homoserine O-acetyltransferase|nr:homoserine O-acetyltransferase [Stellaceae bacterium]
MEAVGTITLPEPLHLECGATLESVDIAYEIYGELNASHSNAVLLCHGLTADQHAVSTQDANGNRPGWWDKAIGPGRALDTSRYCVISTNSLASFGGSTSPASIDPQTGQPYGMRFPFVTMADMADAQAGFADALAIDRFQAVVGGCMGGFQVLEWLLRHPQRLQRAVVISATPRTSTHNTALWHVMREAIRRDPDWRGGDYYDGRPPLAGIGMLAMFGALFWMDRATLDARFGLKTVGNRPLSYGFQSEFEIEAFLDRIAGNATARLDANALIYLTRAIDYFDISRNHRDLKETMQAVTTPTLFVSYTGDWRYPSVEIEDMHQALKAAGGNSTHAVFDSAWGHGGFLQEPEKLEALFHAFFRAGGA